MHLKSASVDLEGNLVAQGTMSHPVDDAEEFPPSGMDQLKIGRDACMTVIQCTAEREDSGFFRTNEVGPLLRVPEALSVIIMRALHRGAKGAMIATIGHQEGELASSSSRIAALSQPLSDWRLRIEETGGDVNVAISAALHAEHLRGWRSSERNFWAGQPGARVEARFSIDAATRTACFGAYIPDDRSDEGGVPAHPLASKGSLLNIENAPVGPLREFGIRNGRWVMFSLGSLDSPMSSFTEHRDVQRLSNGFLSLGDYVWPRLWIRGADLGSIVRSLDAAPIRLSGNGIAASLSNDGREGWSERGYDVAIELRLSAAGLVLDYHLTVGSRRVKEQVILPWELLILRYPALARKRQAILDGCAGE